jgi:membrane protein implicated in regulation of membrane protease activity
MLDTLFIITAVVGGTVMVCQFVLTLMGLSDHGDVGGGLDVDVSGGADGGGFHDVGGHDAGVAGDHHTSVATAADAQLHPDSSWLFGVLSFRTLVTAAAFFGLAGMAALRSGFAPTASLMLAMLAGLAAMYGMYWLMRSISGLATSGNQRIGNALGRRATVYVPIPAGKQGAGKVQLSMQNRIVEFLAVTDEPEKLRTGETVEVVGVAGSDTVFVRRVVETARV